MGQDNLTWGNIVGNEIRIFSTDLLVDQQWNVLISWLILKYNKDTQRLQIKRQA